MKPARQIFSTREVTTMPMSIVWFQRFLLAALAIDLVSNVIAWIRWFDGSGLRTGYQLLFMVGLMFVMLPVALGLVLWYFTARRASIVARWITTVLVILGSIAFVAAAVAGGRTVLQPMFLSAAFTELLKVAAVVCLFGPSATAWFAGQRRLS